MYGKTSMGSCSAYDSGVVCSKARMSEIDRMSAFARISANCVASTLRIGPKYCMTHSFNVLCCTSKNARIGTTVIANSLCGETFRRLKELSTSLIGSSSSVESCTGWSGTWVSDGTERSFSGDMPADGARGGGCESDMVMFNREDECTCSGVRTEALA